MSEPNFLQKLIIDTIDINGNCKITYKRNKKDEKAAKLIFTNGQLSDAENVDMTLITDKNISIFPKIAMLDGKSNDISLTDLSLLREYFNNKEYHYIFEEAGITDVKFNDTTGVGNIEINGAKLNIDFETEADKLKQKYPEVKTEWLPYIMDLSERTNYSADLIAMILSSEAFTPVAEYKKDQNGGLWEVGFGHTTKANHNNKFGKGFRIDLQTAFEWFEQDLKDKEDLIKSFGESYNYENLPHSIQEALIDTAFNRGEKKLNPNAPNFDENYTKLLDAIKEGDYAKAAVLIRQSEDKMANLYKNGLRKRNVKRFLLAIRDLKPFEKGKALILFNENGYYDRTLEGLKQPEDKKVIESLWNDAVSSIIP